MFKLSKLWAGYVYCTMALILRHLMVAAIGPFISNVVLCLQRCFCDANWRGWGCDIGLCLQSLTVTNVGTAKSSAGKLNC